MAELTMEAVRSAMATLMHEILDGSSAESAWILNQNDPGLVGSLARLSARDASTVPPGGSSSTAAHVEHLRFMLALLNAVEPGRNPFANADWGVAWQKQEVSDEEWDRLRAEVAEEGTKWQERFADVLGTGQMSLTGVLASVAHLAYHLGAIRQITPGARGPSHDG